MMNEKSISARQKPASALLWLSYTAFFFIQPVVEPSLRLWLGTLTLFVVFLAVFFIYIRTDSETWRRWMIAATFAIGLASFPWNGGASTFFVYTAAFLPFSVATTGWVLTFFSLEAFSILGESYWFHLHWQNAAFAIFLLLVIGAGNIFFAEQRRADCKLRMAHEEIEALAALAERERIARDLHDVLGHTLSLIVLKAELAGRLVERDPQRAATEIGDVERTARTALAEVREAIGGYRARGLAAEIETARRTLDAAEVTLTVENDMGNAKLTAAEETVLALALREAVTNIVRHAKATNCRLRFVSEGGRRKLLVEDDGEHALVREGNGLRGMRERIEALGGSLRLERERGTRLFIELPLRAEGVVS